MQGKDNIRFKCREGRHHSIPVWRIADAILRGANRVIDTKALACAVNDLKEAYDTTQTDKKTK